MSSLAPPSRRLAAGVGIAAIAAVGAVGASISFTEAQRSASQFASTSFSTVVDPVLVLEGSANGTDWNRSGTTTTLTFRPDQLALQVGEENSIFVSMQVRAGEGTNAGATAVIEEESFSSSSPFAASLRGRIYEGGTTCDEVGIGSGTLITADELLQGQESSNFDIAAPDPVGEAGAATELCLQVWMNDNNWLLGGTVPPTERATWTVTGVSG